jgi:hypothetical protein
VLLFLSSSSNSMGDSKKISSGMDEFARETMAPLEA